MGPGSNVTYHMGTHPREQRGTTENIPFPETMYAGCRDGPQRATEKVVTKHEHTNLDVKNSHQPNSTLCS